MQLRDDGGREMPRSRRIWQAIIVAEVLVMGLGFALGIDMDETKINLANLLDALLGRIDLRSGAWLWVARVALVALVITVIAYRRGPGKRIRPSTGPAPG